MTSVRVTGLVIYPVKSMRGIPLDSARLTPRGLDHDRRFMVVREDGRFVTQRELHRMALISTELTDNGIVLRAEGCGSIQIPSGVEEGDRVVTAVWGDECETIDQGETVSRWLTEALQSGEPLRLVQMAAGFRRPQSQPELLGASTHTHFADAAPMLVANQASLDALNDELDGRGHDRVPMNRFRPNIIVEGLPAFQEHRIAGLAADRFELGFTHPCQRCVVTTIDQDTAQKHPEWQPYKTLRDINPMPGNVRAPAFAHNAILANGDGETVSTGDLLTLVGNQT
jgi:uncharacterized protein YcbX